MSVPRFSVNNRILANMITIVILVGGVFAAMHLRREVFPRSEMDMVIINTVYPSASPAEVEELVTVPIEEELRDVDGIDEYLSSSVEGVSLIIVQIDPDQRNKDRTINDIQRKVDQVKNLPDEVEDPIVESITTDGPVVNVVVTGLEDEGALRDYVDQLKARLEQIPHVSSVTKSGWRDKEFWVEVDPEKLNAQEVSLSQVMAALARRNVTLPGGKLPIGSRELIIRTVGKFYSPEEIDEVIVRSNIDGKQLRVRDIGKARSVFEENATYATAEGERAIILGVKKKSSGDTITIVDAVKALVEKEREVAPDNLSLNITDDESYYVKRRLRVLTNNGLLGFVLVVIVLLVFLNFRVALLTAIGIPFSLLAAIMLMSLVGMTLNMMTMFGLIIVIGMLVDDALIVGENCYRHLELGKDHITAAVEGAEEVMYPVTATVLTTIAAFMPLVFAPDMYGKFLQWLTWVVVLTLSASLFESLFILPSHFADFVRTKRKKGGKTGIENGVGHGWMRWLLGGYTRFLRLILRKRYIFLLIVLLVFVGLGQLVMTKMRLDVFPADLIDIFMVKVAAPQGTTLQNTEKLSYEIEKLVRELPDDELDDIVTYVGQHLDIHWGGSKRGTQYAQIVVYLTPQQTRDRKTQEIMNEIRERASVVEGIEHLEFEMLKHGPPAGKAVEFRVRGGDYDTLQEVADQLKDYLEKQPGVSDVQDDFLPGKEELHVVVDEEVAARFGVDIETIARTVYAGFEGAEATMVRLGKEEVKVRVRLKEPYRSQAECLENLTVPNRTGRLISLKQLARFDRTRGLPTIYHFNGDRVVTVSASVDSDVVSSAEASSALEKRFRDLDKEYPGCSLIRSGEWKEQRKVVGFMVQAFIVALLVIYTILAVQFGSFSQPLLVMVAIPMGFIGVILALIAHGKPVSMMAMMGMVGLAGVVVNDAIVLVDFINKNRKKGMTLIDAIMDGGKKRMRPILLTSITTVFGLMPTIYGWGGYEPFIVPAAITLAYGLVFATFLTLAVVPVVYFVGHDLRLLAMWVMGPVLRLFRGVAEEE